MSERIPMSISTPSSVPMGTNTPTPIRASVPNGAVYVTYQELMEILATYATKEELNNETVMRWGGSNA